MELTSLVEKQCEQEPSDVTWTLTQLNGEAVAPR